MKTSNYIIIFCYTSRKKNNTEERDTTKESSSLTLRTSIIWYIDMEDAVIPNTNPIPTYISIDSLGGTVHLYTLDTMCKEQNSSKLEINEHILNTKIIVFLDSIPRITCKTDIIYLSLIHYVIRSQQHTNTEHFQHTPFDTYVSLRDESIQYPPQ